MGYYVIIRGPLGSGKSTVAKELAKILNAKYIAVDEVLDVNNLTADTEGGYISQKSFLKANKIVAKDACDILNKGGAIVFDGNFYWKSQLDDLMQKLRFQHYAFSLEAPLNVCIKRDSERAKPHGANATQAVYKKSTEISYGITINADRPVDQCVNDILSNLPKLESSDRIIVV